MKLGEKIKYYREKRGYNLTALAQKAGIAKSTLHKIEDNKTNPTINTIWAISKILEIPFGELVDKDAEIKEESNTSVSLIEKNEDTEVYKMTMLNYASYISEPHANGVKEHIYVIKGSLLVGEIQNPKLVSKTESFEFAADIPHIYKAMDEEVIFIVSIFYPKSYEKFFYDDRFIKEFNSSYLDKIKKELENGIDTVRIVPKEDNFDYNEVTKNIQVVKSGSEVFVSLVRKNNLYGIKKFLKSMSCDILRNYNNENLFTYKLLKNEMSIIFQSPKNHISKNEFQFNKNYASNVSDFERRINVDLYSYFEYFHPGYTFQALLISSFLNKNVRGKVLDIGSGPGNHLNLINEFTDKRYQFDCVEPSLKSIYYLKKITNVHTIYQRSFLDQEFDEKFNALLSVGSSHHMNMYEFLEKSFKILNKGGYLIVSDEFTAKYHTKLEREKGLILHHTSYMIKVMYPIKELSSDEKELYDLFRDNIPYVRYLALHNEISLAKNILNKIFNQIKGININSITNNLFAYYLFMILELEALVAGLDYEEECKTYSANLIEIAKEIGFEPLYHVNFYPTYEDAGTQLIVLRKG